MQGGAVLGRKQACNGRARPSRSSSSGWASVALETRGDLVLLRDWPGHVSSES